MTTSQQTRIHDEMSETILHTAEALVLAEGAHALTVRRILRELHISNRVFYNRFHNVEEVLECVYRNTALKLRENLLREPEETENFFTYVTELAVSSLLLSYDIKMNFNNYIFESDSHSENSYSWWTSEIKRHIEHAKAQQLIGEVDSEVMSYAIWCFCRGYNADAVGRGLPREEAVARFRYSFGILLEGMRHTPPSTGKTKDELQPERI